MKNLNTFLSTLFSHLNKLTFQVQKKNQASSNKNFQNEIPVSDSGPESKRHHGAGSDVTTLVIAKKNYLKRYFLRCSYNYLFPFFSIGLVYFCLYRLLVVGEWGGG